MFDKVSNSEPKNSPAKKKNQNWTPEQKLAIIDEAKSSTNFETARKRGVSEGGIQYWRKNEAKSELTQIVQNTRSPPLARFPLVPMSLARPPLLYKFHGHEVSKFEHQ